MAFSLHTSIPARGVTVVTQTHNTGRTTTGVVTQAAPGQPVQVLHAWPHDPAWMGMHGRPENDHLGIHELVVRKIVTGALPVREARHAAS